MAITKVKISDSISTKSSEIAASSTAVKTAYDRASTALNTANSKASSISVSGSTITLKNSAGTALASGTVSGLSAVCLSNIVFERGTLTLPSGGTWVWCRLGDGGSAYCEVSQAAGGTTLSQGTYYFVAFRKA